MTKFSYIQFFYETRLYRGNAVVKILYSSSKKIIRDSRMLVDKKASDFVLSFCPKIVADRQGCIAKKRGVGTTYPHQTQRKTDSPTRISTLDLPVSLLCYGPIHNITCHLFIYAAPGAAHRN